MLQCEEAAPAHVWAGEVLDKKISNWQERWEQSREAQLTLKSKRDQEGGKLPRGWNRRRRQRHRGVEEEAHWRLNC